MDTLPRWAEMANDYLGAGLDLHTADRWQKEIKDSITGVTPKDVCDAIRANKGRNLRHKVRVSDLILWIKEERPVDEHRLSSCNLCHRGWIEYAPEISEEFDLDEYACTYRSVMPCFCASGAHHMETKYPPEAGRNLQKLRQTATVQRQRYNQLVDDIDAEALQRELIGSEVIHRANVNVA